ncbi:hypothetical protein GCM10023187_53900 [Nibrella viscosa]|uniref:Lipoprotein n=1 Tax=Nibrella viscosa TaxID=1084524 RepID=A0ABP8L0V7_9BACT
MKARFQLLFGLPLVITIILLSCEKHIEPISESKDNVNEPINLQELKDWFKKTEGASNGKKASSIEKTVLWDFYQQGYFNNNRNFVVTTLAYKTEDFLRADAIESTESEFKDKLNTNTGLMRKALFFKDTKGQYQKYVLYILPDKNLQEKLKSIKSKKIKGQEFSVIFVSVTGIRKNL